ncbi:MAG: DUF2851 family protein [Flavobacteriaceae bacterium]|nr:DUF2851 family protein [Flavobacteriaceae bacterium]
MALPETLDEALLQYIWQQRLLKTGSYSSIEGQTLKILNPGELNTHAGPDFLDARIEIDGQLWAGSVELHLNAKDWNTHGHQHDPAYSNTVLHVVYENGGKSAVRNDGSFIPVFELHPFIDEHLIERYRYLMDTREVMPCSAFLPKIGKKVVLPWLDRMMIEKLELKNESIANILKQTANDWQAAFYQLLARGFGFGLNGEMYEQLTKAVPFELVKKYQATSENLVALFVGQSGLYEKGSPQMDKNSATYEFLKHKHGLNSAAINWSFFRTRPSNFPSVTLLQLAKLLIDFDILYHVASTGDIEMMKKLMAKKTKLATPLGKAKTESLLLNVFAPFLYALAKYKNDTLLLEKATDFLQQLPPENNSIIRRMNASGIASANAADSQAMLHLHKNYCQKRLCVNCSIGRACLKY